MSDRRGRARSRYDDDYYDGDYYEARPRHRSLGRQALDKLSDAIGLDNTKSHHPASSTSSRTHYPPRTSNNNRAVERYYPPPAHPRDRDRDTTHRRYHSTSPPRSNNSRSSRRASSRSDTTRQRSRSRWERGIEAAAEAAAVEAFRLRHEPGPWRGAKGERLATAAISAGVVGAATEQRKQDGVGGKLGTLGSAVSGLVVNRLVNGPRREVRR